MSDKQLYFLHQSVFIIRKRYYQTLISLFRNSWFKMLGMKIGAGTLLPKIYTTWPHQVSIGKNCVLEDNIYFKFDGIWQKGPSITICDNVFVGANCEFNISKYIYIGNDSLIASGCKFIDHDHGMQVDSLIRCQPNREKSITIGNNVWLGVNVLVLKGVKIEDGAVVAAGSVVTKSIAFNEIWAGIPAKKIGIRE